MLFMLFRCTSVKSAHSVFFVFFWANMNRFCSLLSLFCFPFAYFGCLSFFFPSSFLFLGEELCLLKSRNILTNSSLLNFISDTFLATSLTCSFFVQGFRHTSSCQHYECVPLFFILYFLCARSRAPKTLASGLQHVPCSCRCYTLIWLPSSSMNHIEPRTFLLHALLLMLKKFLTHDVFVVFHRFQGLSLLFPSGAQSPKMFS